MGEGVQALLGDTVEEIEEIDSANPNKELYFVHPSGRTWAREAGGVFATATGQIGFPSFSTCRLFGGDAL